MPNPDFAHPNPSPAIFAPLHAVISQHGPNLHPAVGQAATHVESLLNDNLKAVEDYLNRNTVRRIVVANVLGDGTAHTSLTFVDVAPACVVPIEKAQPRSRLLVTVLVTGLYIDLAAPSYVDLGVHVEGPSGYDEQFAIARTTGRTSGQEMHHLGAKAVAGDCPSGPVVVTLQVRVQAGGEAWESVNNDTISVTVAEVPPS